MSIAVSASVRPSRWLAALCCGMALVLSCASGLLFSRADNAFHRALGSVCAIASASLVLFPLLRRKAFRIDVTGIGQIRLVDTSRDAEAERAGMPCGSGEVVQLLRDSTLWSSLMVLRLQSGSGRVTVLILLPDSMERGAFHALSVACRWVAVTRSSPLAASHDTSLQSD